MNGTSEIKVGSKVILKVGRNAVEVEILKAMADGDAYWVKSIASGKEFMMPSARIKVPTVSIEPVAEPETIENAPPHQRKRKNSLSWMRRWKFSSRAASR